MADALTMPRGREMSAPRLTLGKIKETPVHLAILIVCLLWMVPGVGLLVSSFRPQNLVATTGWWTAFVPPFNFTLDNYQKVLGTYNMAPSFINSLIIAIPATVVPILIAAYAAYAFAWLEFPGRQWLFLLVVGLLVVPIQTTLIPVLQLFVKFGLAGTFLAVWLAHTGYGLPFAIYLLRNFFGSLPASIFESAGIDGAGQLTVFFRLLLPISVPALASLAIFQFLWVWNDLLVALVYLGGQPAVAPLTVTIANLTNSLGQGWQLLTAAAFVSMALPLVIFFSLQRYFARGILAGSVKG